MFSAWTFLLPTITASGGGIGDMIGPIIIFVVIVSQMIRAARTFNKNKPISTTPSTKPQARSPEDELRDFLGGLSAETKQAPAPPPPPPILSTEASHRPPPVVSHKSITILRRTAPKEMPPVIQAAPVVELPQPVAIPVTRLEPMRTGKDRDLIRADIITSLSTRQLLRQAIVLREVLGPPLGLRR
jgi:hypothetical protein